MTTAAVGQRFRIVTIQDGAEHVSSVVLSDVEAIDSLDVEAKLHAAAGWQVERYTFGCVGMGVRATRAPVRRLIFARSFTPHNDTPEGGRL